MLNTLAVALFYSSMLPVGLLIAAFSFFVNFFVDRYLLLRVWQRMPPVDAELANNSRWVILAMVWSHLFIAGFYYAAWPFPTWCELQQRDWDAFCAQSSGSGIAFDEAGCQQVGGFWCAVGVCTDAVTSPPNGEQNKGEAVTENLCLLARAVSKYDSSANPGILSCAGTKVLDGLQTYQLSEKLKTQCENAAGSYESGTPLLNWLVWGAQTLPSVLPNRANPSVIGMYNVLILLTTALVVSYIFKFGVRQWFQTDCLGRIEFCGEDMRVRYIDCVNIKAYVPRIRLVGMGGQKLINDLVAVDPSHMSIMHQRQLRRAQLPVLPQDPLLLRLLRDAATPPQDPLSAFSRTTSSNNSGANSGANEILVDKKVKGYLKRIFGSFRFFAPSVQAEAGSMSDRGSDVFQTIARELTQFVPAGGGHHVAGKLFAAADRAKVLTGEERKRPKQPHEMREIKRSSASGAAPPQTVPVQLHGVVAQVSSPHVTQPQPAVAAAAAATAQRPPPAFELPHAEEHPTVPPAQAQARAQPVEASKTFKTSNIAKYKLHKQVHAAGDSSMDGWWVVGVQADAGSAGTTRPGLVTLSSARPVSAATTAAAPVRAPIQGKPQAREDEL
jgi:hypothetical protein